MSVILFINFVLSTNNEGYKYKKAAKGDYDYDYDSDSETVVYDFEDEDAETVVYDFEEGNDESKECYTYFDESEIFNCESYDKYIKTKEEQTINDIFSFDYVPNYVPSKNEGYKKGDTERAVYYYEGDKECNEKHKGFYMYFDESEIYKYTGECKKLDNISTDDLYNELCVRMSELDEIVVLLSVEKYKSLLDLENERREFEEYKKSEMEKLVREKEREKREFEEYKKAVMEKEMEKLSIELKKEKETFVNDISIELYKYENRPAERIPEEILKRIVNDIGLYVTVPSTDELYPVLYNKNHIQSSNNPLNMYVHTFYYNTGARLDINERRSSNNEVNQLGHSYRSPPYLSDLHGQKVIDSLKQQYKDKYIFTQKMVDIIYKTFDGKKEKFILNNHHLRWSEYESNPSENNVDRLVNALKQERDEYILNLRTLV